MFMLVVVLVIMVMMRFVRSAISAAFGIKGRLNVRNRRAKADKHVMDNMITPDPDGHIGDFCRQMPVSDLPGQRKQMPGVRPAHFHERFGFGTNLDDAPIIQHQPIAMAQQPRLWQIEQEGNCCTVVEPVGHHTHPAAMPRSLIERDGCGRTFKIPGD